MPDKLNPKTAPRASRLLETVRAQAPTRAVTVAHVPAKREIQPAAGKKPDRTVRFPKPENALRQHAATAKVEAVAPVFKVRLARPVAPAKTQSSPKVQALATASGPKRSPSSRPSTVTADAFGAAVGIGALAAIPTPTQLGRLVRLRRTDLGLSQAELALRADVGRRFVAELEAGKPSLELGRALVVCGVLGIQLFAAVADHDY